MKDIKKVIVLVDFGSTFTKVTLVDIKTKRIVCTSKSPTTIETDIYLGYVNAILKTESYQYDIEEVLVCSSAAGGLKMVVSGLVKELTSEAARLVCLGSGAKILDVYSNKLTIGDVKSIKALEPDMILLAGGTDGGNTDVIIHNADCLSSLIDMPYVIAGNKHASDDIRGIFDSRGVTYALTKNVMPELNQVQIEPAKETIRQMFMDNIVEAKGLGKIKTKLNSNVMPTPMAVLKAVELLSESWGDILIIDIGGATTDIHSACHGYPKKASVLHKGLVEPYLKRTVEGDLGMRFSAASTIETIGIEQFSNIYDCDLNKIESYCKNISEEVSRLPLADEKRIEDGIASLAIKTSINRHVGVVEESYSPMGKVYYQTGKDLSDVKIVIGTGGVLVHHPSPYDLIKMSLEKEVGYLKPIDAGVYLDTDYILSAAGLLVEKYPDIALSIMEASIREMGNENET